MAKPKFKIEDTDIQNNIDSIGADEEQEETVEASGRGQNPNSLANIHPRIASDTKTPQRYMQINVWEYEDYLYRMSKLNGTQITKYVMGLIKADAEKPENIQIYEALKQKKEFDKPKKVSNNKKKK